MRRASTRVSDSPSSCVNDCQRRTAKNKFWRRGTYVCDVETAIRVDPRNLARVFLASAAIPGLYARTNTHAAARGTAGTGSAPAAPTFLADQAFFHARLALAIVIANVVGPVAPVPVDLARIILLPASVSRLDGVAFS